MWDVTHHNAKIFFLSPAYNLSHLHHTVVMNSFWMTEWSLTEQCARRQGNTFQPGYENLLLVVCGVRELGTHGRACSKWPLTRESKDNSTFSSPCSCCWQKCISEQLLLPQSIWKGSRWRRRTACLEPSTDAFPKNQTSIAALQNCTEEWQGYAYNVQA